MSLYADYLRERTQDHILEYEFGFVTFRHLDDQKATYIIDIFVKPEFRKEGFASRLADEVKELARSIGHKKLLGTVVPSTKTSTESTKALLGYGMRISSSAQDVIIFEKEIE